MVYYEGSCGADITEEINGDYQYLSCSNGCSISINIDMDGYHYPCDLCRGCRRSGAIDDNFYDHFRLFLDFED